MSHKVHWTKFHNYLIPYKCNYSISLAIFLESVLILGGLGIVLLTNPIDSAFSLNDDSPKHVMVRNFLDYKIKSD